MKNRRLLVEQPFGKRYCNECALWFVGYQFRRECGAFGGEVLQRDKRGWKRCEQCLEAERLAEEMRNG